MTQPAGDTPSTLAEMQPSRGGGRPWLALAIVTAALLVTGGLAAVAYGLLHGGRAGQRPAAAGSQTLVVNLVCTNGLYCINQDDQRCVFGAKDVLGAEAHYPKQSLTVTGPDGTVLAAKQLPIDGNVGRGGLGAGGYECAATVSVTVPQQHIYTVDAFGMTSASGMGPSFTLRFP